MSILISVLEKNQASEVLSSRTREILTILLAAINDWPRPIVHLADFEKEVYRFIGNEMDRTKLKEVISKIDCSKHAWEAESLSQLIEIYSYYDDKKSLKEIFDEIEKQLMEQDNSTSANIFGKFK